MIPEDLRAVAQWLVSGHDKIPISPKTGRAADVRDRSLYVSYSDAVTYARQHNLDIGFVLTHDDPFTVIDLDSAKATDEQQARHKLIFEAFDTYAELSRSRAGVHIWCRGSVPRGTRRDHVEIYSADRYMICTGLVLKSLPIADYQDLLNTLFAEMGRTAYGDVALEEHDSVASDEEVFEIAMNAVNGEKFDQLARGEWQGDYPSQSEADFALMNILCFYTRSNEQAKRLFRYSALGKRDKAQREQYLDYMIRKIRAEETPPVDLSGLKPNGKGPILHIDPAMRGPGPWEMHAPPVYGSGNGPKGITAPQKKSPPKAAVKSDFTYPPGFVGEIARYIYESSTRPVVEVSVSASLALAAGIIGRQFNISGTGLNQYLILLAKTGVGKEDGPRGIERLLKATRETVPAVDAFMGPGTFASGQAIIRTLDEQPCFFSVLGEFGYTLQELSDTNTNSLNRVMKRVLLDLYSKSGRSSVLAGSAYSDSQKNTKTLYAPAMTLYGESTPESFYEGLSLHHIESGLIPRFLIIEYEGDRTDRNPKAFHAPPKPLVQRFGEVAATALQMQANQSWADVTLSDEAKAVMDKFDAACDVHIRGGVNEAVRQLWNRAHLKALRVAAVLCAMDRPHTPVVNEAEAKWAIDLVARDVERLSEKFESGDVGEGDSKQIADLERIIRDFLQRPVEELATYGVSQSMKSAGVIPHVYLQRRAVNLSSFRKDKRGARAALVDTIKELVRMGRLIEVPKQQSREHFNNTGAMYSIGV